MTKKTGSLERVKQHAITLGLNIDILELPDSTRTAIEAANACGCDVAQIVKSMIFERSDDNSLVLILVSGAHNADMTRLRDYFGCALGRADPKKIRKQTGFSIGGVAPIGHINPIPIYMDKTLFDYTELWAAAGQPNAVFKIAPNSLLNAIDAKKIEV